jgi:predicted ATPase
VRIYGRSVELKLVDETVHSTLAGRNRLRMLLVLGEAGMGKTALADHAIASARSANVLVGVGRGWKDEGTPELWPWMQVLRQLRDQVGTGIEAPELVSLVSDGQTAPSSSDPATRFRLFTAVVDTLASCASRQPMLIVLEDLHWADLLSVRLLEFVIAQCREQRIAMIATARTGEAGPQSTLMRSLTALVAAPGATRLELSGLSRADSADLLGETLHDRVDDHTTDVLHERTGGNPFFLAEAARMLRDTRETRDTEPADLLVHLPDTVREVVVGRVRGLPQDTQSALSVAAVIGRQFDVAVLASVLATDHDHVLDLLESALASEILVEDVEVLDRYRFTHRLMRDALCGTQTRSRRARHHARIAAAVEQLRPAQVVPTHREFSSCCS